MKEIDNKMMEAKKTLKNLKREKNMIKTLIAKEKEKKKVDSDIEETFFSRISSLKLTSQKSRTSLDKFGSSITTISPRSPKSKTNTEEQGGGASEESHFSFHKGYSKSLTFPDKFTDLKISTGQKVDSYDHVSPDFKKQNLFEDKRIRDQVRKEMSQQNNLNDSLYEEINQQLVNSSNSKLGKLDLFYLGQENHIKKVKQKETSREGGLSRQNKDNIKHGFNQTESSPAFIPNKQKEENQKEKSSQSHLLGFESKFKTRF